MNGVFTPIPQASPQSNLLLSLPFQSPHSHLLSSRGLNINAHPSILFALPNKLTNAQLFARVQAPRTPTVK